MEKLCDKDGLHVFLKEVSERISERQVILLKGDLGAGKTYSTKGLLKILGVTDSVDSPTYALHNSYVGEGRFPIHHYDLYRLESEEDLESTGFWEVFLEERGLVIIEWPERIQDWQLIPSSWSVNVLNLQIESENLRRVSFE